MAMDRLDDLNDERRLLLWFFHCRDVGVVVNALAIEHSALNVTKIEKRLQRNMM
jgi:hypothetical protein